MMGGDACVALVGGVSFASDVSSGTQGGASVPTQHHSRPYRDNELEMPWQAASQNIEQLSINIKPRWINKKYEC